MCSQTHTSRKAPEYRSRKNAALRSFFSSWWPWPLTFDPKFELGWNFRTMRLTAKLHHPTFNRSEVIVLTNKLTNTQTNRRRWKTSTSLRYAAPVGKNAVDKFWRVNWQTDTSATDRPLIDCCILRRHVFPCRGRCLPSITLRDFQYGRREYLFLGEVNNANITTRAFLPPFSLLLVCLSVCLLATLRKNFRTDLHEIFREGWQWANEQVIKFWWRYGSPSGYRHCFPDSSLLGDKESG